MSACCSAFECAADQHFNGRKAAEELKRYRTKGPGPTTRLLQQGLEQAGTLSGTLLDIGSGIGSLTFGLLERAPESTHGRRELRGAAMKPCSGPPATSAYWPTMKPSGLMPNAMVANAVTCAVTAVTTGRRRIATPYRMRSSRRFRDRNIDDCNTDRIVCN